MELELTIAEAIGARDLIGRITFGDLNTEHEATGARKIYNELCKQIAREQGV